MASRFILPFADVGNGITPEDGAKLFFFETGTSTPKNTFTNEALTTPNANPVIADANGVFSDIWMPDGGRYKAQLKDKNDVQQWEADPVIGGGSSILAKEPFDNIAALVASKNLNIGDIVKTAGYLVKGDGGDNEYEIVAAATGTADGGSFIDLTGISGQAKGLFPGGEIKIKQFGAATDGATDDSPEAQAAIDFLTALGGSVVISNTEKVLIDTALTIKPNVSLVGPHEIVGSPKDNNSAPYGGMGGALIINSAVTITVQGGASISGLLMYRKGMTFPASDSSAFAGTALTLGGDDAAVFSSMLLGFTQAITSSGFQRARLYDLNIDCVNGILIDNAADIARLESVHCWPFATIAAAGPATSLERAGAAFKFTTLGDWNKLTDCFSFGYATGYLLDSVNSMTLVSCSADGTAVLAGSFGFNIINGCTDTRLIGCQAAAQETGYRFDTDLIADLPSEVIGCSAFGNTSNGMLIDGGDVRVDGGIYRDSINGISVNNLNSRVFIDNARFDSLSTLPVNCFVSTELLTIGDNNDFGSLAVGNAVVNNNKATTTVSSAAVLPLTADINFYRVTGATTINQMAAGWSGRRVTLLIVSGLTMVHGFAGGASADDMVLQGAVNFVAPAGSIIELIHDSGLWYELSRRV